MNYLKPGASVLMFVCLSSLAFAGEDNGQQVNSISLGTTRVIYPAGSREPGAGSREPGAGSREPGAGSREPGAGSREPGAGGYR
ncbi:TPA: hypothetical protein ACIVLV_003610 [Salmonella enterica subsp. enterica serovar Mississippi]